MITKMQIRELSESKKPVLEATPKSVEKTLEMTSLDASEVVIEGNKAKGNWDYAGRWSDYRLDAQDDIDFLAEYLKKEGYKVRKSKLEDPDLLDDLGVDEDDLGKAWITREIENELKTALPGSTLTYLDDGTFEVTLS